MDILFTILLVVGLIALLYRFVKGGAVDEGGETGGPGGDYAAPENPSRPDPTIREEQK